MYIDGVKEFDLQLEINSGSAFVADSKRMSVVLNNIISNAFKYKDDTKKSYLKITFRNDINLAKSYSVVREYFVKPLKLETVETL